MEISGDAGEGAGRAIPHASEAAPSEDGLVSLYAVPWQSCGNRREGICRQHIKGQGNHAYQREKHWEKVVTARDKKHARTTRQIEHSPADNGSPPCQQLL